MKAFGSKVWDAPVIDELEEPVTTPHGHTCSYCNEAIKEDDDGFLVPFYTGGTPLERPVHTECWLRQVLGSVGHLKGTCSCMGGTEEDPEGATKHEAALAVKDFLIERGGVYREW